MIKIISTWLKDLYFLTKNRFIVNEESTDYQVKMHNSLQVEPSVTSVGIIKIVNFNIYH